MAEKLDLVIAKGKTFTYVVRWESETISYAPITAATQAAPVVLTSPAHGIPNGWRAAVVSVKGMVQLNAANDPPKDKDYHAVTVVGANQVALNAVNSSGYKPYTAGGYLQFFTPIDLSGYTARMSIKDKVGGTELIRLDTTNSRIELNNTDKTITLTISATDTAAMAWSKGVYDLELVSAAGVVTALLAGRVTVTTEVTTS